MSQTITRTIPASPQRVWDLWTTAEGIGQWWAPDGFTTTVDELDLRVGGRLRYTMTSTAPEQVAFMQEHGMPLATPSTKTFTELDAPHRLAYDSLVDFVPGHQPYQQATTITLTPTDDGTLVEMIVGPMHDDEWTNRLVAGRTNELDKLARLLATE